MPCRGERLNFQCVTHVGNIVEYPLCFYSLAVPHSPHPFLTHSAFFNFSYYRFIPTKFKRDASIWRERRMHIAASVDNSRQAAFSFLKLSPWQQNRKQEVVCSIGMVWRDNACELLGPLLSCHLSALQSGHCRHRKTLPMLLYVCVRMLVCTRADGSSAVDFLCESGPLGVMGILGAWR